MLCASTPNISPRWGFGFFCDGCYKHGAPPELGTESKSCLRSEEMATTSADTIVMTTEKFRTERLGDGIGGIRCRMESFLDISVSHFSVVLLIVVNLPDLMPSKPLFSVCSALSVVQSPFLGSFAFQFR
jgi:hypothetical protein